MAENDTLLAKYVGLKRTMRKLEAEIGSLNEAIYAEIEKVGGKLVGPDYTVSSRQRPNYRFSETHQRKQADIDGLREQLNQLDQREVRDGVAEVESHTHIVTVRLD